MQKTKQISFRIPASLHKRLKVYASSRGKTIRQVILESLPFNRKATAVDISGWVNQK